MYFTRPCWVRCCLVEHDKGKGRKRVVLRAWLLILFLFCAVGTWHGLARARGQGLVHVLGCVQMYCISPCWVGNVLVKHETVKRQFARRWLALGMFLDRALGFGLGLVQGSWLGLGMCLRVLGRVWFGRLRFRSRRLQVGNARCVMCK